MVSDKEQLQNSEFGGAKSRHVSLQCIQIFVAFEKEARYRAGLPADCVGDRGNPRSGATTRYIRRRAYG